MSQRKPWVDARLKGSAKGSAWQCANDGVIELRPTVAVPADQAWFWTERWQQREREVDAHLAAGEVRTDESTDDFLGALDALAAEADSSR